jgi:ribonuclease H / adenosylcobalamin/alpha-ribazole phosphatase
VHAILRTDGGARGNPGPAGIGVVLLSSDETVIAEIAEPIGVATNNVAEYRALIAGLELARARGVTDVTCQVDSELVVAQLQGRWKIRSDRLRHLAARAGSLLARFESARLTHVRRELNARADELANEAMDAASGLEGDAEQTSILE